MREGLPIVPDDEANKLGPLKTPSAPKVRKPIYLEQEAKKLGSVEELER